MFQQNAVAAVQRDELAVGNQPGQLAGAVEAAHGIAAGVHHQGRHGQLRGQIRDVQIEKGRFEPGRRSPAGS